MIGEIQETDSDLKEGMFVDRGTTRKYALAGAALLLLILVSVCARVYVDWLWFRSLDFGSVFTTTLLSKLGVQSLVLAVTFLIIFINLIIARRYVIGNRPAEVNDEGRKIIYLETDYPWQRLLRTRASWWMLLAASVFIAFVVGSVGGDKWVIVQQYLHAVPFGKVDPVFGKELSFYVFNLKFYQFAYGILMASLVLAAVAAAIVYLMTTTLELFLTDWREFSWPKKHLAVLLAAILILKAWGYKLAAYKLLYSPSGVVFGAGYTDIHARLLGYKVLMVVALLVGLATILNIFINRLSWIVAGLGVWLAVSVFFTGIYPVLMQKFVVEPNELARETRYIRHNISMTRDAYGFDKVESKTFDIKYDLTAEDIRNNEDTILGTSACGTGNP